MNPSEDLTEVYATLAKITAGHDAKRAENRAWVAKHMPAVNELFDQLQQAGMGPVLKRLERFV